MFNRILPRIQTRLTAAFLLVALIPLTVIGLYGAWAATNALRQQALQAEGNSVKHLSIEIQEFLENAADDAILLARSVSLRELLAAIDAGDPAAIAAQRRRLADEFIAFARTRDIYFKIRYIDATGQEVVEIEADDGTFRISEGEKLQNESSDDYFINGMRLDEGEVYATRLRLETQGGVIIAPYIPGIRYSAPVFYGGKRRGVLVTNVDARSFLGTLQHGGEKSGEMFLTDMDGFYLWHTNEAKRWSSPTDLDTGERLQKDLPRLAADILSGQAGTAVAGNWAIAYTPIVPKSHQGDTWVLVKMEPLAKVLAPVAGFRNMFLGLAVLAVILAIGAGAYLSRLITRPLVELGWIADQISQGDLTQEVTTQGSDEIGQLAQAFDRMSRDLRHLIQQVRVTADRVATAAEELSTMSEQINSSAGQVTTTVQQVAQGATTQVAQAGQISQAITDLATATDQIAGNAQRTEQASEHARALADRLAQMMQALRRRSQDINDMAATIKRFADQTNLLALNAAIEAARAGEHGKSFAVVAEEVRRLAESSRQAVSEITELNAHIQAEVQQVLVGMEEIMAAVEETAALARQNASATAQQRQAADAVVRSANQIATITEQHAAGAEEMAAAVEEQTTATEQLATAAHELSEMAAELQEVISQFQTQERGQ